MKKKNHYEIKKYYEKLLDDNFSEELLASKNFNPLLYRSLDKRVNKEKQPLYIRVINKIKSYKNSKNFCSIKSKKIKYIVITHIVSPDSTNDKEDFYFGKVNDYCNESEILYIYINHIDPGKLKLCKNKKNFIILGKSLNFFSEFKITLKTLLKIFIFSIRNDKKFFSLKSVFSSVYNQRVCIQILRIIKNLNIDKILFTFEGNPYEKLLCYKIKEQKKRPILLGYQFSVLRYSQISMFMKIKKNIYPDKILTINQFNKNLLLENFNNIEILQVGSLKNKNKLNLKKKNKINKNILVIPEGILSEIDLLIKFCLNNLSKEYKFIFRLHPIYENYLSKVKFCQNENLIISDKSIQEDFQRCNYVIHRGSSAVIDAVNNGLVPIYLSKKNEVTNDPFFKINKNFILDIDTSFYQNFKNFNKNILIFNSELESIRYFSKNFYKETDLNFLKKNS